jgi:outer membrane protein TolC
VRAIEKNLMKLKNSTFAIVFVILSFISLASASENLPDANNLRRLSDYLQYAALRNAALEASFQDFKAAVEQVPQAKSLPDPKFTYSYFIREVETRVGPQEQKFGIMQVFPWFGTIEARAGSAAAQAKAAKKRYDAEKLKLFWKVKEAFYEYVYLASAVDIAKQNLELLKHFEEVARTRYAAAAGGHPDVIRAQVELAKLEDILKSLEKLREPTVARLNAILNRQIS